MSASVSFHHQFLCYLWSAQLSLFYELFVPWYLVNSCLQRIFSFTFSFYLKFSTHYCCCYAPFFPCSIYVANTSKI
jgi:hypothetical protein